jgi:hypothetical protein
MEKIEMHKQNAAIAGSNREVIVVVLEITKNYAGGSHSNVIFAAPIRRSKGLQK